MQLSRSCKYYQYINTCPQMIRRAFYLTIISFLISYVSLAQDFNYQLPPQAIIDLVDAPSTPSVSIGTKAGKILLMHNSELPDISDLAAPELRLAGIRIDPLTSGPSRSSYSIGLSLMNLDGTNEVNVSGLPKQARIRSISWSPDQQHIAFTHTTGNSIELWVVEVATATAQKLSEIAMNEVLGTAFGWMPDSHSLLVKVCPDDRGQAPSANEIPKGPVVQENLGRKAAVPTFQDLLKSPADEALFDYYATTELKLLKLDGSISPVGKKAVYGSFSVSPDGQYILVTRYQKPYSYNVPYNRFPQVFELLSPEGKLVRLLAEIPLSDNLPKGFDAVRTGMRGAGWRSDASSTLFWVEAIDGGDPAAKATFRDQLYFMKAPFQGEPIPSVQLNLRFGGIQWGKEDYALITEYWRKDRQTRTSSFHPGIENGSLSTVFERSSEDQYNNPGRFQTTDNASGFPVLQFDTSEKSLFLFGQGASPEGNRPFVDLYEVKSGKISRLWQSEAPYFENPVKLIDIKKLTVITRRESVEQQPNYFLRGLRKKQLSQLTFFPDPMPALKAMKRELIHYKRSDSIPLSGTLYLPEGYKPGVDAPLPTLLWAYPNEYKSADAAGQVSGSPYSFTRVGATSPIMLVTQGYAVLNDASFPIVGEGSNEPNDSFIPQLVANAEAAINKLVEMGVTDRERVAVSGHSYGAFMTANLLTHSNLFAAGVARSGAYNRSLTPFGFQGEERTYWEASDLYQNISPFMHADKMKSPLLLIHGAADNNSGTFTMQTERYFDALRGLGATARMVLLPHESHGYRARESVLHMHWEWIKWLDKYVKNKEVQKKM
jgi:dipeptidyl aminopeptidase/acylaminoacyl peptidase